MLNGGGVVIFNKVALFVAFFYLIEIKLYDTQLK